MEYRVNIVLHERYEVYIEAEDEEQAEDIAWEMLNDGKIDMLCAWDDTTVEAQDYV